ncbi:2-keto-4-pentenoate hydratase [Pseudoblastomonas halimionae]|uniref:2-keto-4-pentenoate hydratase n=1 Tax=Alteriqipengyuania halimionae TaxID=1926630 RepID=A0A6I4U2Y7_9SPHN|nr:2-keto-4-pentenoate hydratase [Alteriqipengyuania halimionae]MXP10298.1 2-keto-4-pentenoate hydratase [Alteriqipengyuania halimionae]
MSHTIAQAFVDARRKRSGLREYPGERPQTLADAYAIQDAALAIWKRAIGGWKVGRINPPDSDRLGAERLAGPVFADTIVRADGEPADFAIFSDGFAAAEAEFMLRLAPRDGALPTTPTEAMEWVDEVRIGLEIASSPYPDINTDGPCVTISDHGNNAGLQLGPTVDKTHWSSLDDVEVSLSIDGRTAGRATTATMLDGPFGSVCFLLANLQQRGIATQAGWWISSGAITGVHKVESGNDVIAHFGDLGSVSAQID